MKIGFDSVPLMAGVEAPEATALLHRAKELGGEGVQFCTIDAFSGRDEENVRLVGDTARDLDLYLEVGMGACNPASDCRAGGEAGRDVRDVLREMIQIARWSGATVVRTFVGWLQERSLDQPAWAEQLKQTAEILREVAPEAQAADIRICLENHMDITARELVDLMKSVDSPVIGVCLDTANPLMLCEDPVEATRILAPYTYCTHIKDAALTGTADCPQYVAAGIGQGIVDLPAILDILQNNSPCQTLSIEDHGGVWELPKPSQDDTTLTEMWKTNLSRRNEWLATGNAKVAEGILTPLSEMFDAPAQTILAGRLVENVRKLHSMM